MAQLPSERRLARLLRLGGQITGELDLDSVLRHLLNAAREVTGARYAALGILDEHKRELERFLTEGMEETVRHQIGDLPRGRGVLGLLIQERRPLRLHDVGDHPRSYGFPAGHPPMRSFLGVPISIRGEAFGNLYLTEKASGDFDATDEEAAVVLADLAAVAIDNARLFEQAETRRVELERAVRRLETTVEVSRALGAETDLSRVLELIAKRARALVDARVLVILLSEAGRVTVAATAGEIERGRRGATWPLEGTVAERALTMRAAQRVVDAPARMAPAVRALGIEASTALVAPLVFQGQSVGVLQAYDRLSGDPAFNADDEALLEAFATSAATAVRTAQSVERDRLEQAIVASELERRRWARELHDETLQGLVGLRLMLTAANRGSADEIRGAVTRAVDQLDIEVSNLRSLIRELRPAALDELGLGPALESLVELIAAREGVGIELTAVDARSGHGRLAPEIENTIYRLTQEALHNAVRHAHAQSIEVELSDGEGVVAIEVRDDGRGFDPQHADAGFGLRGMRERIELVNGELAVESAPGQGTVIRATVPARRCPAGASNGPLTAGDVASG